MSAVTIRPTVDDDVDVFYVHQADPIATDMAVFPARDREAHVRHWRERVFGDPNTRTRTVLVDGVVAGYIGSWLDAQARRLLGYWIGREFWGRGIATDGLRQFVAEIGDRPLYAYVVDTNIGSQRVLEKTGFVRADEEPHTSDDGITEILYVLN